MEQSPLERAARALADNMPSSYEIDTGDMDAMKRTARAVLMSVREPSEGMKSVGYDADQEGCACYDCPDPIKIYQAMLDTAIKGE